MSLHSLQTIPNPVKSIASALPKRREKPIPPHCRNCGEATSLEYCPRCGQRNTKDAVTFEDIWSDFTDEFLKWDGKLLRTLWLLVAKPGVLTVEYVSGRRIRYFTPFRMYLVISATFFLLLSRLTPIQFNGSEKLGEIVNNVAVNVTNAKAKTTVTAKTPTKNPKNDYGIAINNSEMSFFGEKIDFSKLPKSQSEYSKQQEKLEAQKRDTLLHRYLTERILQFNADPSGQMKNIVYSFLPNMFFLMLPVFAILLKLMYVRQKRYYLEHLIFALHTHAYYGLLGIVAVLAEWRLGDSPTSIMVTMGLVMVALGYTTLALRRVYGQGWPMTLWKGNVLFNGYGILLSFAAIVAFVFSALFPN